MSAPNNQNRPQKKKPKINVKKSRLSTQRKNPAIERLTHPKAPVSVGTVAAVRKPRMRYTKNGTVIVSHSELIGNVNGSTALAISTNNINPGLLAMFPWLNNMATNYESYRFRMLNFRYSPACSTATNGYVYLTTEFDPSDPVPEYENQLAAYDGCVFGSVWSPHIYKCAQKNLHKRSSYFVRSGSLANTSDLPLYDTGYLVVATTGGPDANIIGKLWVDYEVEFSTPQLGSPAVGKALSALFSGSNDFTTVPGKAGNAPLTASVAGGVLTLTASQPYQALVNVNVAGTGILSFDTTGTTAILSQSTTIINGAGTAAVLSTNVSFPAAGSTLSLAIDATTVSATRSRFGQYNVANN